MNYKLINKQTGESHLCIKGVQDGYDYYFNDSPFDEKDYYLDTSTYTIRFGSNNHVTGGYKKRIIATNNPDIDIPQIMDVEYLANNHSVEDNVWSKESFTEGYNQSQETYPYTHKDMLEFVKFCLEEDLVNEIKLKELEVFLVNWKEQNPKIVYYEHNT